MLDRCRGDLHILEFLVSAWLKNTASVALGEVPEADILEAVYTRYLGGDRERHRRHISAIAALSQFEYPLNRGGSRTIPRSRRCGRMPSWSVSRKRWRAFLWSFSATSTLLQRDVSSKPPFDVESSALARRTDTYSIGSPSMSDPFRPTSSRFSPVTSQRTR